MRKQSPGAVGLGIRAWQAAARKRRKRLTREGGERGREREREIALACFFFSTLFLLCCPNATLSAPASCSSC